VLLGDVAEVAEEIIRETCKEFDIEIIDMAVNVDHVHLFIKNPFRKSVYKTFKKSLIKNVSQSAEVFR
jgi:putative transposase